MLVSGLPDDVGENCDCKVVVSSDLLLVKKLIGKSTRQELMLV